ncbi:MAG: insulinase family protein [Lachnospiraceae bacterium]|nr:insulinase family protein [Lachnospiraceae bacterium]
MVKTIELKNGIRVVLEPMEHLRTVSFGVWVKVGSVNETIENNGISHVIEHCLFKGTKTRTAKQLADEISAIGDQLNAFTGKECTAFYGVTLTEYLPKMMELVGDMLQNSTFEEEPLQKELGVILEEIDMYDDSPEDLVHELLEKNVWKDHALGYIISGEKPVVSAMTREQIAEYMRLHYCGSNMVISIAGNYKEEEVLYHLEQYFSEIPRFGTGMDRNRDAGTVPEFHRCICERKKDVEQLYMNFAFQTMNEREEQRHVQIMANAVLGGSNNSRLFQQIREELGLAYSVYSYSSLYRYAGLFHVDVIVNPANAVTVYEKLEQILEEFSGTVMKQEELESLYTQLRIEMIMGSESARNRMERNAKALLMHDRVIPLEETLEKLSRVSAEEIQNFGKNYLKLEQAGVCLVGDIPEEGHRLFVPRRR